ncbi:MAG: hypothetical protein KF803_02880 [Cyclobacteriaceae bacterium]|nr:hypothetical protein [Cyclobacteriaceae bacterium]
MIKGFQLILAILYFNSNALLGQDKWSVTTFKDSLAVEYDLVQQHASVRHCFPEIRNCKAISVQSKKALEAHSLNRKILDYFGIDSEQLYGQFMALTKPIDLEFNKARLEMNFLAHNVTEILVVFHSGSDKWIARPFVVTQEGYQPAQHAYLITFDQEHVDKFQRDKIHITGIGIYFLKAKPDSASKLIVGAFRVQEFHAYRPGLVAPWLAPMFKDKEHAGYALMDSYSTWFYQQLHSVSRPFTDIPSFDEFSVQQGLVSPITQFHTDKPKEKLMLHDFLCLAIKNYPYSEEKGIDVNQVIMELDNVFNQSDKIDRSLITEVSRFIESRFKDPHFKLILPPEFSAELPRKTFGPVRIKEIGGHLKVVANFDEEYCEQIPVGSIVTSINQFSAVEFMTGKRNLEEELYRQAHEAVELTVIHPNNSTIERKFQIRYDRRLKIPQNFRVRHGEFKLIENAVPYFRIRTWSGENIYNLLNHRAEILEAGTVIIDLRGNGGGNGREVFNVLSLFFNNINSIGERQHDDFRESITIIPNQEELRIPSGIRVAILVDSETACASEIFLIGMKKRPGTIIIGDSNTMGAVASPNFFRFPSGVQVEYHSAFRKFIFNPSVYREGHGIAPDILVSRTSVHDLYPYKDKVCAVAYTILNR